MQCLRKPDKAETLCRAPILLCTTMPAGFQRAVADMSVAELKQHILEAGMSFEGVLDKAELREIASRAIHSADDEDDTLTEFTDFASESPLMASASEERGAHQTRRRHTPTAKLVCAVCAAAVCMSIAPIAITLHLHAAVPPDAAMEPAMSVFEPPPSSPASPPHAPPSPSPAPPPPPPSPRPPPPVVPIQAPESALTKFLAKHHRIQPPPSAPSPYLPPPPSPSPPPSPLPPRPSPNPTPPPQPPSPPSPPPPLPPPSRPPPMPPAPPAPPRPPSSPPPPAPPPHIQVYALPTAEQAARPNYVLDRLNARFVPLPLRLRPDMRSSCTAPAVNASAHCTEATLPSPQVLCWAAIE